MKILLIFILYGLPEAFLLILASLGLLGLRIRPSRIIIAGLGLGAIGILSREFLGNSGMHTPIILAAMILIFVFWFRLTLSTAAIGCFLSFFLLLMGEMLLFLPVKSLLEIDTQTIFNSLWLYIGFGWLSDGFLLFAALICHLTGKPLVRAPEARGS